VETKREQSVLAKEALEADGILSLDDRESMTKVKSTVHIRVRKSNHELLLRGIFRRVSRDIMLKELSILPLVTNSLLNTDQVITTKGRLLLVSLFRRHL
jgi:hypothetical protein